MSVPSILPRPLPALAALLLLIHAALPAGADPAAVDLFVGVSSRSMLTLLVEPQLRWERGIVERETTIGARLELPMLLVIAGETDTVAVSLVGTHELLRNETAPFHWPAGGTPERGGRSLRVSARIGIDSQAQSLGRFFSLTTALGADLGVITGTVRPALRAEWKQALATYWVPAASLPGSGSAAPAQTQNGGWLFVDRGRLFFGVGFDWREAGTVGVDGALMAVISPNPFIRGFDGMMFGQWPFFCYLRTNVTAGANER